METRRKGTQCHSDARALLLSHGIVIYVILIMIIIIIALDEVFHDSSGAIILCLSVGVDFNRGDTLQGHGQRERERP
jgi:hypothetical protein